jgi:AcrR family transcriptional regulator
MPRVGLTRERLVMESAAVADAAGLEGFTLAAVAERCGVSLPGLYKHTAGLDGTKRDIALLAVRELTVALSLAAVGLAGKEALAAMAQAYRSYAAERPGRYAASIRAPAPGDTEHEEAGAEAIAVLYAVLKGYRIEVADKVDAIRYTRAVLHGFAALEAGGGFGLPQSLDLTFERLIDALDAAFAHWSAAEGESQPSQGDHPD